MWMSRWCYRCTHDHNFHSDNGSQTDPCLHQLNLYMHEPDPVFFASNDDPRAVVDRWTCIEFSRCACDNGPNDPPAKPPPTPPDPNQFALFDVDEVAAGVPADVWHDTFTNETVS
jgi:hypothetical protein